MSTRPACRSLGNSERREPIWCLNYVLHLSWKYSRVRSVTLKRLASQMLIIPSMETIAVVTLVKMIQTPRPPSTRSLSSTAELIRWWNSSSRGRERKLSLPPILLTHILNRHNWQTLEVPSGLNSKIPLICSCISTMPSHLTESKTSYLISKATRVARSTMSTRSESRMKQHSLGTKPSSPSLRGLDWANSSLKSHV